MVLFKNQRRPKGFSRKPVYWNPEREERELREKRILAELGLTAEDKDKPAAYRADIKGKFRSAAHGDRDELREQKKKTHRKMLLLGALLIVVVYFLFTGLPAIERLLEKIASN